MQSRIIVAVRHRSARLFRLSVLVGALVGVPLSTSPSLAQASDITVTLNPAEVREFARLTDDRWLTAKPDGFSLLAKLHRAIDAQPAHEWDEFRLATSPCDLPSCNKEAAR